MKLSSISWVRRLEIWGEGDGLEKYRIIVLLTILRMGFEYGEEIRYYWIFEAKINRIYSLMNAWISNYIVVGYTLDN